MRKFTFKIKQRIIFAVKSKSEFSVHSPIVFNLVHEAVLRKKKEKLTARQSIISAVDKVFADCEVINITKNNIFLLNEGSNSDIDRVFVVNNIHSSKEDNILWKNIVQGLGIVAFIEFFDCGVIIQHKNIRRKQGFIVRI